MRLGQHEELFVAEENVLRRQDRALAIGFQELVARFGVGPEALDGGVDVANHGHAGLCRQVVEEGCGFVEEQRQVVFDAGRGDAAADVLVDHGARRVAFKCFAPAAAERGARSFIHREFAAWQQAYFLDRVQRALGVGIEGADGFDGIAEQVQAIRQGGTHREQVDQAAAHGVFAGRHDLAHVGVAGQGQLRLQLGLVQRLALLEEEGVGSQERGRRHAHQRSRGRDDGDVALAGLDLMQGRQALGHQVLVRREGVVRQGFPVRQQVAAQATVGEPRDFGQQALAVAGLGYDHGQHLAARFQFECRLRQRVGVTGAEQVGQREAVARLGECFFEVERHANVALTGRH